MAAEGNLVKRSDHDSIFHCIFVLDRYRHFASMIRRAHSLDKPGSSSRAIVGTREDVQEPGKPSNRSPGRGSLRDPNHVLVDVQIERR